jgi:hypothetical protein
MAANESRYTSLDDVEDVDLENDSDTTLASDGFLRKNSSKRISKYVKSPRLESILTWARWGTIVLLQGLILVLLLPTSGVLIDGWSMGGGWSQSKTETGGDINGLYIPSEQKNFSNLLFVLLILPQPHIRTPSSR